MTQQRQEELKQETVRLRWFLLLPSDLLCLRTHPSYSLPELSSCGGTQRSAKGMASSRPQVYLQEGCLIEAPLRFDDTLRHRLVNHYFSLSTAKGKLKFKTKTKTNECCQIPVSIRRTPSTLNPTQNLLLES